VKLLIYSHFFPPIVGGNSCFGCAFAVMPGDIEERVRWGCEVFHNAPDEVTHMWNLAFAETDHAKSPFWFASIVSGYGYGSNVDLWGTT
jgi:hypothetical protein